MTHPEFNVFGLFTILPYPLFPSLRFGKGVKCEIGGLRVRSTRKPPISPILPSPAFGHGLPILPGHAAGTGGQAGGGVEDLSTAGR